MYPVLGRTIEIYSLSCAKISIPNVYEIEGSEVLKQIGLKEKFWFQLPGFFSINFPETEDDFVSRPKFLSHRVLASHLQELILEGISNVVIANEVKQPVFSEIASSFVPHSSQ